MPGLCLGLLDSHAREQRRQRRELLRELAAFNNERDRLDLDTLIDETGVVRNPQRSGNSCAAAVAGPTWARRD